MPLPNKFVSMDLELNTLSQEAPCTDIIQIGACIADCETKQILDSFSVFIKPSEPLSEFIIALTGITQVQVDNGSTLEDAYRAFISWRNLHKDDRLSYSGVQWGHGDFETLLQQLQDKCPQVLTECPWPFAKTHFDIKKLYQTYRMANGKSLPSGLAKSLTNMGLKFRGKIHNALDDSRMTAEMLFTLLDKMKDK